MELTGEQAIAAPRAAVWAGLNDPDVLRQCVPGCQSIEPVGADRFDAVVAIKIGPIGARFTGAITLSDIDAPNGYTISGEGQGGGAGFARGSARVRLEGADDETIVHYLVDAQVGGKIAQLGGAIIDATARRLAGQFFKRFAEVMNARAAAVPGADVPADGPFTADAGSPVPPAVGGAAPLLPPVDRGASGGLTVLSGVRGGFGWVAPLLIAALAGLLIGMAAPIVQPLGGVALALLLAILAIASFEYGRRVGGPRIHLAPVDRR